MENVKSIFISGDYAPINRIRKMSVEGRHSEIFGDILPVIKDADFSITNLECPLTDTIVPIDKTGPALSASPECINSLAFAGFDLVTLANNHILDQGYNGLKDTLDICQRNSIETVGAGLTKENACKVFYVSLDNTKIAFIAIAENEWSTIGYYDYGANALDPVDNYYAIVEAKKNADIVIVMAHGGHEMYQLPTIRMQKTYRFFIDIGADFVIGHHTHCVSGYENYKNKTIIYSLGNFIFDLGIMSSIWHIGMAVLIKITENKTDFELIPFRQNGEKAGIEILKRKEKNDFFLMLNDLNNKINNHLLEDEFEQFCKTQTKRYKSHLEPYNSKYIHFLRNRGLIPSCLKKSKKLILENIIRCESHREIIVHILNNENKRLS